METWLLKKEVWISQRWQFRIGGNHLPKRVQAVSTKTMVWVNTALHSNIRVTNHRESLQRMMEIEKSSEQNFYKPFVVSDLPFKATILKDFKPITKILSQRLCSHTKSRMSLQKWCRCFVAGPIHVTRLAGKQLVSLPPALPQNWHVLKLISIKMEYNNSHFHCLTIL
jgi:hypothetical protein